LKVTPASVISRKLESDRAVDMGLEGDAGFGDLA
jgi:hypothetical protein